MAKNTRNRGLGRGLSALMADVAPEADTSDGEGRIRPETLLAIENVQPNPDQPRRTYDDTALNDLAASISAKGIIQPLIVRPLGDSVAYEIVAGERRWRAAQIANLHQVPVIIREFTDVEVLEVAIIENIQRADLNAIDEAAGFRQLIDRFGHTQEQLASALGKSRSHIANQMRLLSLPSSIQDLIVSDRLSAGHARALIGVENAEVLAREVVQKQLSVRDVEKLVKKAKDKTPKMTSPAIEKDADTKMIEQELSAALSMRVVIDHNAGKEDGKLTLNYRNLGQLDDLLSKLSM